MNTTGSAFVIGGLSISRELCNNRQSSPTLISQALVPWKLTNNRVKKKPASGIGRACALAFARRGVSGLVVADVDLQAAESLAAECRAEAGSAGTADALGCAEATRVDVADERSVELAVSFARRVLGRVDYCVNSAGVRGRLVSCSVSFENRLFLRLFPYNTCC